MSFLEIICLMSLALRISETIFTAVMRLLSANSVLYSIRLSVFSLSVLCSVEGRFHVIRYLSPSLLLAQPSQRWEQECRMPTTLLRNVVSCSSRAPDSLQKWLRRHDMKITCCFMPGMFISRLPSPDETFSLIITAPSYPNDI